MANGLKDLLDAITKGTAIDITVIDLTSETGPRAHSAAYLRILEKLAQWARVENLAQHIYQMLDDISRNDKAESLRSWLNSLVEPTDAALIQLERERAHADPETIEKELVVIADALDPVIAHGRKAILEITHRHRLAIADVDFSDLLVPVPRQD